MADADAKPEGYSVDLGANNPRREDLCYFIDSFNDLENFSETRPSTFLRGGWYAMEKSNRTANPDWMAQAAHSFREVHYDFIDNRGFFFRAKRLLARFAIKYKIFKFKNVPRKGA